MARSNYRQPIIPIIPTSQERIAPGYLFREEVLYTIEYWQGETAYCCPSTMAELEELRQEVNQMVEKQQQQQPIMGQPTLEHLLVLSGLSRNELAMRADLDIKVLCRALKGERVARQSVQKLLDVLNAELHTRYTPEGLTDVHMV